MKIKLIIASRLSYYFCGTISLSILNTIENPVEVLLESLTKQEILGLSKASKTGVISIVEGQEALASKAKDYVKPKFIKEDVTPVVEVKEDVQPVVEVVEVVEVEKVEQEAVIEEVKDLEEEVIKPVARKRNTTKK